MKMKRRETISRLMMIVLAAALLLPAACVTDKEEPIWSLATGDPLPEFEVTTLSGMTVSSADSYRSELVIVFFNTTCPDCRKELPLLQQQYEANLTLPEAEQKLYICISREEGQADVERYWKENSLTIPVSAQADRHVYSLFASSGIPRIFQARDGLILKSTDLSNLTED